MNFRLFPVVLAAFAVSACAEKKTAALWTTQPEFVLYAQQYNASQDTYTIEVHYAEAPQQLQDSNADIIVAPSLAHGQTRKIFSSLNYLFKQKHLNPEDFYPALLRHGQTGANHYLLPVSFNVPAIIFSQNNQDKLMDSAITIDIETLKREGAAYNERSGGLWSRLGYSPLWDDGSHAQIYLIARLFGADFREDAANVISWNDEALQSALDYISDWIKESTGAIQAQDDFIYQYFFDPPYKLLADGRILFAYMESNSFFTPQGDEHAALDFRWLSREDGAGEIPVSESIVSLGIPKRAKAPKAAADFARWFFNSQTQNAILKKEHDYHLSGAVFGIAGGFSSLRTVTEFIFPKYYTRLMGHTPPPELLDVPETLPPNWEKIKEEVIYPYMLSQIRDSQDTRGLRERLTGWQRIKQGQF